MQLLRPHLLLRRPPSFPATAAAAAKTPVTSALPAPGAGTVYRSPNSVEYLPRSRVAALAGLAGNFGGRNICFPATEGLSEKAGRGGRTTMATTTAAAAAASVSDRARDPVALPLAPLPADTKVKVALCQLAITQDKERNIAHARAAIEKAADEGARLVMLPEMWNCPYSNDSFPTFAEEGMDAANAADGFPTSPSARMLAEVAAAKKIVIVGGSMPERRDGKLFNTSLVFGADGKFLGKFSKVHLFDIDIPGQITFRESLTLTAGDDLLVVDSEVGCIGVAICYDIRFPELAMLYAARGVHILCYPGAFNMTTGPLHWELLQRARAADNQVFVVTCAPARDMTASYTAWGHSTIVSPLGVVLATTEHEETTVFADIDLAEIPTRRKGLPFTTQRRGDLYTLIDRTRA